MTKLRNAAIVVMMLYAGHGVAADVLQVSHDATIVVAADESWEDPDRDVLHFRGNFEIRTPHWAVMAERATVFGKLDNLERVIADGSPVQFLFQDEGPNGRSTTHGEGRHLEYDTEPGVIKLTGKARMTNGGRVMTSSKLQYSLKEKKLQVSGPEGVHITDTPDRSGSF